MSASGREAHERTRHDLNDRDRDDGHWGGRDVAHRREQQQGSDRDERHRERHEQDAKGQGQPGLRRRSLRSVSIAGRHRLVPVGA
jgi:hypothetical protein